MEIEFMPIDYEALELEDKSYVRIIGRTGNGKRVCLIDECDIYFWAIVKEGISDTERIVSASSNSRGAQELKSKVLDKKIESLREKILGLKVMDGSRVTKVIKTSVLDKKFLGQSVKAIKVFLDNYKNMQKLAEKISNFEEIDKVREHDLHLITRYILEKKLVPMGWSKVKGEIIGEKEFGGIVDGIDADIFLNISKIEEIEKKEGIFTPRVLGFDIETDGFEIGKGKILMISLVCDGVKKVLTWKKVSGAGNFVESFSSEKEMLEAFVKHFKKLSPDIITGYFSDSFDLPYLKSRAEVNKVKLSLGIDNTLTKFSGGRSPRGKISGIVHVDLYKFIDTAYSQYLQSETLGLNDVASELLGEKKKEYEFKPSSKMSDKDWKDFFEYNLQDSVLTYNLFMKVWPDMEEFCRVMQEPLFNVSRDGMSSNVENYIIHNLAKYNEIAEMKPEHHVIEKRRIREKYEGAFVLQPVPKLYDNIAMFDFTSYWPSIIATFNLSLSTYLGSHKLKDMKNVLEVDTGEKSGGNYYFSKQKGFFPQMLEEVIKKRKQYKEDYKKNPSPLLKARSNAFKLLANASYGYQGFFGARYYCPEASASTTALSRNFIKKVIEKSEKEGFHAIYSDTDSIALELGKKNKKQALDFLKKINDDLPGIMELELEDFYTRGIWVTTRKGEFGAKKKYALINESGKMKIRGFETVRRDWCTLARELQNNVLFKILKEGDEKSALEYTKDLIKKIEARKIDRSKLVIRTQLKKPLSEYIANTPHVTIARKMIQQGMPVNQGMLISYYIAESADKKALTRERAAFIDDEQPYDVKYYLEKQILPAVENIFMVFGVSGEELIGGKKQKTLGDF
jgi:DNA polymerase I/DNA polymerase-2